MALNRKRLSTALSVIHEENGHIFRSGFFDNVSGDVHSNAIATRDPKLLRLYMCLTSILMDLWNIETICLRLAWQKNLWSQDQLDNDLWLQFGGCDISLFHIELRSIFDYLAKVINIISDSPEQVPGKSFNKLRNWVSKSESNVAILGADLAQLVASCEWFDDIREARDSMLHRGAHTLVFLTKDRITFQIITGIDTLSLPDEVMYDKNVADFELYAGLHIAYLLSSLEDISKLIRSRMNLKRGHHGAQSSSPGLRIVRNWIERILSP